MQPPPAPQQNVRFLHKEVSSGFCITAPVDLSDDFRHVEVWTFSSSCLALMPCREHVISTACRRLCTSGQSLKGLPRYGGRFTRLSRVCPSSHIRPPPAPQHMPEFMVTFHLLNFGPRAAEQHPWLVIYVVVTP